jgi:hypothetical protein
MKGCSKYVSAPTNNIATEGYLEGQFLLEEETFSMDNNNNNNNNNNNSINLFKCLPTASGLEAGCKTTLKIKYWILKQYS